MLWIHSDEKWFKALVPRTNAKECAELGIERDSFSVHHKCHIQQASDAATTTRAAAACFTAWCYLPPPPLVNYLRFFISQVMVHATVGFAFDGAPENGGHGLKISLDRACCARVALKDQRKATRHADGSLHYDGELIPTQDKADARSASSAVWAQATAVPHKTTAIGAQTARPPLQ